MNRLPEPQGVRLYIFPVILPLAALLPWLLSLVGLLAGALRLFHRYLPRSALIRRGLSVICIAALTGGAWMIIRAQLRAPVAEAGSMLVSEREFPPVERFPTSALQDSGVEDGQLLKLLWSTPSTRQNLSRPTLHDDLVLVGTVAGTIDALSKRDGSYLWSVRKTEPIFAPITISATRAYVGEGVHMSGPSSLTAIDAATGAPIWERRFSSHVEAGVVVDEDRHRLWVAAGEAGLWSINALDGSVIWRSQLGHMDVPIIRKEARLFALSKPKENEVGSVLNEIDPESGRSSGQAVLVGDPMELVQVGATDMLMASTAMSQIGGVKGKDAGWLYAIDPGLRIVWRLELEASPLPQAALSADGSRAFFALANGNLICLDTNSGAIVWEKKAGSSFQSGVSLAVEDGRSLVLAVSFDGHVTIRDPLDGREIQSLDISPGLSHAIYAQGRLYISSPFELRAYGGLFGSLK